MKLADECSGDVGACCGLTPRPYATRGRVVRLMAMMWPMTSKVVHLSKDTDGIFRPRGKYFRIYQGEILAGGATLFNTSAGNYGMAQIISEDIGRKF